MEELEDLTSILAGCAVLGLSRATVYRSRAVRFYGPLPRRVAGIQPNALSDAERVEILKILNGDAFLDKSPAHRGGSAAGQFHFLAGSRDRGADVVLRATFV